MANHLYRTGEFHIDGIPGSINQLEGRFAFINQIDRYNNLQSWIQNKSQKPNRRQQIYNLGGREKEYQKFLFYKYFYNPAKPTVVLEGKTDELYLKAALKKYHDDYPRLIKQKKEGFEYKISFLRKTKRLEYFFGLNQFGGHTFVNVYYLYSQPGKNNNTELAKYFTDICGAKPPNPVILLFDNEQIRGKQKKDKPLLHFKHVAGIEGPVDLSRKVEIGENVISNLYIATVPLMEDMKEGEMEDLFPDYVLKSEINGKVFSRESGFDKTKYCSKDRFSKYIYDHYKEIDFSQFKILLDELNEIIESYESY